MRVKKSEEEQRPYVIQGYGIIDPEVGVFTDKGGPIGRFTHKHAGRDLSVIMITPTRGTMHVRVVDSWMAMMKVPNQKFAPLWAVGMEVGFGYQALIEMILSSEELSKFRYVLTVEEDNLPPPLGLVTLVEAAFEHDYDVLGGLYYVKGSAGFAQIWGDVTDPEENYRPQNPRCGGEGEQLIVPCYGTGMGFTLFKLDVFRRVKPPWFETRYQEDGNWTQDLFFYHQAREQKVDLKVGIHCGVRVGHLDVATNVVW